MQILLTIWLQGNYLHIYFLVKKEELFRRVRIIHGFLTNCLKRG